MTLVFKKPRTKEKVYMNKTQKKNLWHVKDTKKGSG